MSEEIFENVTKSDSNFAPTFIDNHSLPGINCNGNCFMKSNTSIPKKVINLFISYTLGLQFENSQILD